MASNDSKKLTELLEIIKHKIDMLGAGQTAQSAQLSMVRDQSSLINSKLDSHSVSLINIETTLAGYADSYKINKGNIERLDDRVSKVEDHLDIQISPELAIQR